MHTAFLRLVFLKLPWIGSISLQFEKQVKSNVQNCFRAVDLCVIFQTRKILLSIHVQCPSLIKVWSYINRCAAVIAGTWIAHLYDCKINPTKVLPKRNCKNITPLHQQDCGSAIGLHLIQNLDCASHYHIDQFSILAKARILSHLGTLEATFIKTLKPILCRQ